MRVRGILQPMRPWIAVMVGLAALSAAEARAGVPPPEPDSLGSKLMVVGIMVLPSDIGIFIPGYSPDLVLAWSWQLPFTENDRHRVLLGFDVIPTADDHRARARAGYRYAIGYVIAGLTAAYTAGDPTWSPELGFRIGRDRSGTLHLLARAEIPIAVDGFRGVALLAGWGLL